MYRMCPTRRAVLCVCVRGALLQALRALLSGPEEQLLQQQLQEKADDDAKARRAATNG